MPLQPMRCIALTSAILTAMTLVASAPTASKAQTWPTKTITIIVPFPAGGSSDVVARLVAAALNEKLGQQVITENRAGAAGNIGAAAVARAAPDGYTLLLATPGPGANNKLLYRSMPYDPERDFTPIVEVADTPVIMVTSPKSPVKTMAELIAYAKAHPGKLNVGFPGNGTYGHLAVELLQRQAGIKLTLVPYRGGAPLTTDLLGSQVDIGADFMPTYIPLVTKGSLGALVVMAPERSDLLPQVPTAREGGLADLDAAGWFALMGPRDMPVEAVQKINAIVNAFLQSDSAKKQLAALGTRPVGSTPDHLRALIAKELATWGPIIREANISLD
jgi:tripartite-type tricarboxylate transporter receptor subunit TctC